MFFITALSIWAAAHLLVGLRLIRPLHMSRARQALAWLGVLLAYVLAPLALVGDRAFEAGDWFIPLRWLGYVYMGFFALLFPLVVVRDVAFGFGRLASAIANKTRGKSGTGLSNPERRKFLTNASNAGLLATSGVLTGVGFFQARRTAAVVEVDVPVRNLAPDLDGYRIVQLTDVHVGPTIKRSYLEPIVDAVNELEADLIAVTGDLVDGFVWELRPHVEPLASLRATHGTFFVTGNHEYYWGADEWSKEVSRLGLTVLANEHRIVTKGNARLLVGGVTDYQAHRFGREHASDPARALEGAQPADFKLLLAHQPKSIHAAARAGFDLQISGHTHGGQMFPYNLFVGLAHPFAVGLHLYEQTQIYVSRGTGYWGPPMRLGVPSEITLLRLRPA